LKELSLLPGPIGSDPASEDAAQIQEADACHRSKNGRCRIFVLK